ncbi:MAG TPA: hypothetical protein VFP67_10610 [Acidimicrobiia bacterium]|nr:hypothetical protein [Acidimicrobiia bacterium]
MSDLHQTRRTIVVLVVLGLVIVSCGPSPADERAAPETSTTIVSGVTSVYGLPQGGEPVDLEPAEFTVAIDNPYWPMDPGSQWVYREVDEEGSTLEVVVTVTTETKEIANGVMARVVRDTVTQDGELLEDTFDWYAQDSAGAIWYLGEDTAEFEDGEITSTAGSFEAGVDGALPGIIMPAEPAAGMRYRQEYHEGEAEDNGEILSIQEQAEAPAGHYEDAILTKDTITIEPDVLEYKLYARGVGPVLVFGVSGGGGREELIEFHQVDESIARAAGTAPLGEPYLDR